jgi:hypothetical protein
MDKTVRQADDPNLQCNDVECWDKENGSCAESDNKHCGVTGRKTRLGAKSSSGYEMAEDHIYN